MMSGLSGASSQRQEPAHWTLRRRMRRARLKLWLVLDDPWDTTFACLWSMVLVVMIVLSIWYSIFERPAWGEVAELIEPITRLDKVINLVFFADTILRFWAYPLHCKFIRDPKNAIDVISLCPFIFNFASGI